MNKELLVKILTFLKEEPDIQGLTIEQIEMRFYDFEGFLVELVEESLQDKQGEHGTLTTWWLYDHSDKVFYEGDKETNVESAEDFVNFMIESNVKD